MGQATTAWTPYYGTHGENGGYGTYGYVPAASTLPHIVTQFDALGQTVRAVQADGTSSSAVYGPAAQIAEDGNQHVRLSHTDALGRVVGVDEALVDYSDAFGDGTLGTGWASAGTVAETAGSLQNHRPQVAQTRQLHLGCRLGRQGAQVRPVLQ